MSEVPSAACPSAVRAAKSKSGAVKKCGARKCGAIGSSVGRCRVVMTTIAQAPGPGHPPFRSITRSADPRVLAGRPCQAVRGS